MTRKYIELLSEAYDNVSGGSCIEGYHGSNVKGIEKFVLSHKGGRFGDGVYITNNYDEAYQHGNYIYKVKFCLEDPYIVSIGSGQIDKERISKWFNNYKRNGESMEGKDIPDDAIIDYALHDKTNNSFGAMGFDGIVFKKDDDTVYYVVFDPDKVTITK